MIVEANGNFERPDAGLFIGTIIDVVDLGLVQSKNPAFPDAKVRVRIIWVLDKFDSKGKPYTITEQPPASISVGKKKSRLYEIIEGVTGAAPGSRYDTEALIGRSNQLGIVKDGEYSNIKWFAPVPAGAVPPQAPAGFERASVKAAKAAVAAGAPPAQAAQPAQAVAAQQVATAVQPAAVQSSPAPTAGAAPTPDARF